MKTEQYSTDCCAQVPLQLHCREKYHLQTLIMFLLMHAQFLHLFPSSAASNRQFTICCRPYMTFAPFSTRAATMLMLAFFSIAKTRGVFWKERSAYSWIDGHGRFVVHKFMIPHGAISRRLAIWNFIHISIGHSKLKRRSHMNPRQHQDHIWSNDRQQFSILGLYCSWKQTPTAMLILYLASFPGYIKKEKMVW